MRRRSPIDAGRARRGQPRLVAARHDLGPRRPGAGAGGRGRPAGRPPTRSPRSCASATRPRIPVTAAAGRSGVVRLVGARSTAASCSTCAASPGIRRVDDASLTVDVLAGTFGDHFEHELRTDHGLTFGHWPQSVTLSTVGGWLACRGAGQLSTRYGKIEDMVVGLDVVLADGTTVHTGGNARQAAGPDLNQLFVGSEGTLGIITGARLRLHPAPVHERRAGLRLRRRSPTASTPAAASCAGAPRPRCCASTTPSSPTAATSTGDQAMLLVLDEGDPALVDATIEVVEEECAGAAPLRTSTWSSAGSATATTSPSSRRSSAAGSSSTPWRSPGRGRSCRPSTKPRSLPSGGAAARSPRRPTSRTPTPTAPASTSRSPASRTRTAKDAYYRAAWDAGTRAVLAHGGALSHHHGVGLNRARFMREALGAGLDVLAVDQDGARPERHPQPGQARPAQPVRPQPLRRSPTPRDRTRSGRVARRSTSPAVARGAAVGAAMIAACRHRAEPRPRPTRASAASRWPSILVALGWCGWVAAKAAGDRILVHGALAAAVRLRDRAGHRRRAPADPGRDRAPGGHRVHRSAVDVVRHRSAPSSATDTSNASRRAMMTRRTDRHHQRDQGGTDREHPRHRRRHQQRAERRDPPGRHGGDRAPP